MNRTVQITADGSPTIAIEEMAVTYHSKHGAIQESMHVFIDAGLKHVLKNGCKTVSIFEMGFGTGLNALLSWKMAKELDLTLYYYSVDRFPLSENEWQQLSYGEQSGSADEFGQLHKAAWDTDVVIDDHLALHKSYNSLLEIKVSRQFHLIYFDAFAPAAQPELWTEAVFRKMFSFLLPGGVLVTYCSKGVVRRSMISAGFSVEKIPGPPGKREMLRAIKS